ncbi:hypothetical protein FOCC_FOCC005476 [Frankliniella occidentalis]|nr:hypothetical protein FOCC_FOCC005476 [Frankliniella occidentalis]
MADLEPRGRHPHAPLAAHAHAHACPGCGKAYKWKRNLRRHLLQECGKLARYTCPYCQYVSKHKSDLRRHCRRRHAGLLVGQQHLADLGGEDPLCLQDAGGEHEPRGALPAAMPVQPQPPHGVAAVMPVVEWAATPAPAPAPAPDLGPDPNPLVRTIAITPSGRQIYVTTHAAS